MRDVIFAFVLRGFTISPPLKTLDSAEKLHDHLVRMWCDY